MAALVKPEGRSAMSGPGRGRALYSFRWVNHFIAFNTLAHHDVSEGLGATYARARDTNDLVRLIASKQLEVALLREGDAHAVFTGAEPFADNGRVALRTLGALGEHLFVCLEEVPKAAAYMLVEALAERWRDLDAALVRQASGPKPPQALRVPLHPGALEFYRDHT